MLITQLTSILLLLIAPCYDSISAVKVISTNVNPWANEFNSVELSCLIESNFTASPRVEWIKIKNGKQGFVYHEKQITGDLKNRAMVQEPATLVILNATRSDTAPYICEVTAPDDDEVYDEILVYLVIRVKPVVPTCSVPKMVLVGKSVELSCMENEGFPKSQYQWFYNKEEIPVDPKMRPKFSNSFYVLNRATGTLKFSVVREEDAGEYYCRAKNEAGVSVCGPQMMEVYHKGITGIILGFQLTLILFLSITVGIGCVYRQRHFATQKHRGSNLIALMKVDSRNHVITEDEVKNGCLMQAQAGVD